MSDSAISDPTLISTAPPGQNPLQGLITPIAEITEIARMMRAQPQPHLSVERVRLKHHYVITGDFVARLIRSMQVNGLSRYGVADRAGVSVGVIDKILKGNCQIRVGTAQRLYDAVPGLALHVVATKRSLRQRLMGWLRGKR